MSSDTFIETWFTFTDSMAPQQESFDSIFIICSWLWLALGTLAVAQAQAKNIQARLVLELAEAMSTTVALLALGGAILGFYLTVGAAIALLGIFITHYLFYQFVNQAQRWLTDIESTQYMRAGFAVIITNGICCITLVAA